MHTLVRWLSPLLLLVLPIGVFADQESMASGDQDVYWHPPYLVIDVPHQPPVSVVLPWQKGYWHRAPSPPHPPSPPGVFQRHGMWRDDVARQRPDGETRREGARIESHAGGTITRSRGQSGSRIETHPGGSVIRSRPRGE
ncbi:hypothetical protein [Billgrantia montanilacus]|uniref:Uncharacterized protein n=1 Tax=Billgrantia montanilacus TaxID=2282305 RepID=A0A368U3T1_9GAMM|nr:hypothetical protein [Halomonas montanilacus]RCV89683.1 hypothetical protein DU505_08750 [Halomonas montanilacus]